MSHQRFALVRRPAQRSSPPVGERGMLAAVLGATALLMFGSLTLVAASLTFQSASSTGSDGEQAVDAAEWGFNSIIEKLNTDPYRHLLVTKWANGNWDTGAGNARAGCGISTAAPVGTADIRSGLQDVGSLQVSYTLTNFVPPQYPGAAPPRCTTFGNLSGGTARLEVKGEVKRGGEVIATHTLVRDVTVGADVTTTTPAPISPAMAVLDLGNGGNISSSLLRYDANSDWRYNATFDSVRLTPYSLISFSSPTFSASGYTRQAYTTVSFLDNFRARPPSNETAAGLGSIGSSAWGEVWAESGKAGVPTWFPFANNTFTSLLPYCKSITLPTRTDGPNEEVIGCKIRNLILKNGDFIVRTDKTQKPVVIYLMGNVNSVLLEEGRRIVNQRFLDTRDQDPMSWGYLRIYGDPATPNLTPPSITMASTRSTLAQCGNGDKQTIDVKPSAQILGAFLWIPKGEFNFDSSGTAGVGLFGAVWGCKINSMASGFRMLLNKDVATTRLAFDRIFGRPSGQSVSRYFTRGVERSQ